MPKCASTSTEKVLRPFGQITTDSEPAFKHFNYRQYKRFFTPILATRLRDKPEPNDQIEIVCLFREPVDWVNSWYRYRTRRALATMPGGKRKSTANMSFEEFSREYVSSNPRPFAHVGRQIDFIKDKHGQIGDIKVFRYEKYEDFLAYMAKKVGKPLAAPKLNVSPRVNGVIERPPFLVDYLREEYAFYETLD
jgi:hypothetical protein